VATKQSAYEIRNRGIKQDEQCVLLKGPFDDVNTCSFVCGLVRTTLVLAELTFEIECYD
jgi:hypothetical protein